MDSQPDAVLCSSHLKTWSGYKNLPIQHFSLDDDGKGVVVLFRKGVGPLIRRDLQEFWHLPEDSESSMQLLPGDQVQFGSKIWTYDEVQKNLAHDVEFKESAQRAEAKGHKLRKKREARATRSRRKQGAPEDSKKLPVFAAGLLTAIPYFIGRLFFLEQEGTTWFTSVAELGEAQEAFLGLGLTALLLFGADRVARRLGVWSLLLYLLLFLALAPWSIGLVGITAPLVIVAFVLFLLAFGAAWLDQRINEVGVISVVVVVIASPFLLNGGLPSWGSVDGLSPESASEIAVQLSRSGQSEAALDTLSAGGVTATLSGDLDALDELLSEMEQLGGG